MYFLLFLVKEMVLRSSSFSTGATVYSAIFWPPSSYSLETTHSSLLENRKHATFLQSIKLSLCWSLSFKTCTSSIQNSELVWRHHKGEIKGHHRIHKNSRKKFQNTKQSTFRTRKSYSNYKAPFLIIPIPQHQTSLS